MNALAPVLNKNYKLASSENFDEIMKAYGANWMVRKLVGSLSPTVVLSEKDGMYSFTTQSNYKKTEIKFRIGEEFKEETPDGREVTSIITQDGNTLTHVQKGGKITTIIREFTPEQVKMVMSVDDVVCTRIYKALLGSVATTTGNKSGRPVR